MDSPYPKYKTKLHRICTMLEGKKLQKSNSREKSMYSIRRYSWNIAQMRDGMT